MARLVQKQKTRIARPEQPDEMETEQEGETETGSGAGAGAQGTRSVARTVEEEEEELKEASENLEYLLKARSAADGEKLASYRHAMHRCTLGHYWRCCL